MEPRFANVGCSGLHRLARPVRASPLRSVVPLEGGGGVPPTRGRTLLRTWRTRPVPPPGTRVESADRDASDVLLCNGRVCVTRRLPRAMLSVVRLDRASFLPSKARGVALSRTCSLG